MFFYKINNFVICRVDEVKIYIHTKHESKLVYIKNRETKYNPSNKLSNTPGIIKTVLNFKEAHVSIHTQRNKSGMGFITIEIIY